MPDLVTHCAAVLVPAAFLPRRWLALASPLALGAGIPDLVSSVPTAAALWALRHGFVQDERVALPWIALHSPIPLALAIAALSAAVRTEDRAVTATALAVGAASHLALDVLQDHHGTGYYLLYPFSLWNGELAWMGTEATVRFAPLLLLLTVAVWAVRGGLLWRTSRSNTGESGRTDAAAIE